MRKEPRTRTVGARCCTGRIRGEVSHVEGTDVRVDDDIAGETDEHAERDEE